MFVEVFIVGVGFVGSVCVCVFFCVGVDVLLVDQYFFGCDKICGDGLIFDVYQVLVWLGLLDEVMCCVQLVVYVGCIGLCGGCIDVFGLLVVLLCCEFDVFLL